MTARPLPLLALAMVSGAGWAADFTESAQVISATPIIERVTSTRQECDPSSASAPPQQERSLAGPIIGGIAGAILGNQVGQGGGRTAATAAGAIAGGIVGDKVGNAPAARDDRRAQPHCRSIESMQDVVKGYNVVYRFHGRDVSTTLPYNPGSRVEVAVGIVPGVPPGAQAYPPPAQYTGGAAPPQYTGGGPPPPPPGGGSYPYRY